MHKSKPQDIPFYASDGYNEKDNMFTNYLEKSECLLYWNYKIMQLLWKII